MTIVRRARQIGPLFVLACAILLLISAAPAGARTVERGLGISSFAQEPAGDREAELAEMVDGLSASVLRIDLHWADAETARGIYADAGYLARIDAAVTGAHARGLKVMVTVFDTPKWASDRSFWDNPPPGYGNGYYPFFPMTPEARGDFAAFSEHLATLLRGKVYAYECWNEPNLYPFFFPQQSNGDGAFAVHTYAKYLKAFSAGIRAGDPDAQVVAGTTAPGGGNDVYRTSPQRFAQILKETGAGDDFDAYSHHPYTVGGSTDVDPAAAPPRPSVLVTLGNIETLLDIWPDKPFYLTEYGYNTAFTSSFGISVAETVQARYLRKAYAVAARHPQVKMLLWWGLRDWSPLGDTYSSGGIYTGLYGLDGHRKRAWYAFAGGNAITLKAPTSAGRNDSVRLQGSYTCGSIGGVADTPLLLQRKWGTGAWTTLRTVRTGVGGYYKAFVRLQRTSRYRLVFDGVVASRAASVRLR